MPLRPTVGLATSPDVWDSTAFDPVLVIFSRVGTVGTADAPVGDEGEVEPLSLEAIRLFAETARGCVRSALKAAKATRMSEAARAAHAATAG